MLPARGGATLGGLGETPWVDDALSAVWNKLVATVPPEALPRELTRVPRGRERSVQEYGCGAFGCVMPTYTPGLVLKITSDQSEAWFARQALALSGIDGWPEGIVRYSRVLPIQATDAHGDPLTLLWREEVQYGGTPRAAKAALSTYTEIAGELLTDLPMTIHGRHEVLEKANTEAARSFAYEYLYEEQLRGKPNFERIAVKAASDMNLLRPRRIAVMLACARAAASGMLATEFATIGATLLYYADKNIVITDTHIGNIARALSDNRWVISDPGNVVSWGDARVSRHPTARA